MKCIPQKILSLRLSDHDAKFDLIHLFFFLHFFSRWGKCSAAFTQRLAAPKFNSETKTSTRIFCPGYPSLPNGSRKDFDNSSKPLKKSVRRPESGIDKLPIPEYSENGDSQTSESTKIWTSCTYARGIRPNVMNEIVLHGMD